MRISKVAAYSLFVAFIPLLLITINTRLVINWPSLYSYGFNKYDIPEKTGIELDELIEAGLQIRNYFNDDSEILDVRIFIRGIRRSIYSEREILHMKDVKQLVKGTYLVQYITAAYLVAFLLVTVGLARSGVIRISLQLLSYGGLLTLAVMFAIGLGSILGFDRLFLAFHIISFSNDLWQLDPRHHLLLAMFPEGFFFDATMIIALLTLIEAAILAAAGQILRVLRALSS